MNQKVLARTLQESLCDPHLDFGRFVGTNSFLAAAYWSEFPGATDLTHPGPPPTFSSRGGSCFPLAEGQRQRALGGSRPAAGGLCPLCFHASPGRKRLARARSQRSAPATTPRGLTCRSPETAALPRPPPRVLEVEVPGPTEQWRSRKLAPRLPQAGSRLGPTCGRGGQAGASAFLLPAWR